MKNILSFPLGQLKPFKKIFCLVSGGLDSTYLFELLQAHFPEKTIPVNCYNPFEQNPTLSQIKENEKFVEVHPAKSIAPLEVLKKSFLQIPKAKELKVRGKYHKKIFPCCRILKHEMFKKDRVFKAPYSVVVSGIKKGDGTQRSWFLSQLKKGQPKIGGSKSVNNYRIKYCNAPTPAPTFFHMQKWGALYCYPFRDYNQKKIPTSIIHELQKKYPAVRPTGCIYCPVLLVFEKELLVNADPFTQKRIALSKDFYAKIKREQKEEVVI